MKQIFVGLRSCTAIWMVASGCFWGWYTLAHATKVGTDVPVLETMQFELLSTDNGKLQFTVKANELYQYENGNVALAGEIEILVLDNNSDRDQEEHITTIQANTLTYHKQEQLCIIAGNVRIQKPSEELKIHTEELSYNVEKEIVFTEVPIEIEHKKTLLKGTGLFSTKDFKQYTIKGPHGTMEMEEGVVPEQ